MKSFRVEIKTRGDPRGKFVKKEFEALGAIGIEEVEVRDVYYILAEISKRQAEFIASELLCDPVIEEYYLSEPTPQPIEHIGEGKGFEILYNPGVTDPKEESIKKAIADLEIKIDGAKKATKYIFKGAFDEQKIIEYAELFLYNPLVLQVL